MKWTEGHLHIAMRRILSSNGWKLIAGEFPGGSDHDLYPLNVVDRSVARDNSPDPRRHSQNELIPDLVALRGVDLLIAEAKCRFSLDDLAKLQMLIQRRERDLHHALEKFAIDRSVIGIVPVQKLILRPALVFPADKATPPPPPAGFSYLRVTDMKSGFFQGALA